MHCPTHITHPVPKHLESGRNDRNPTHSEEPSGSFAWFIPTTRRNRTPTKGAGLTSHCRRSPKGSCFTSFFKINSYDRTDIFRETTIGRQVPLTRIQIHEENLSWRQRHRLPRVIMSPHLQDVPTNEHPLRCICCIPSQRLGLGDSGGARRIGESSP